jgi:hypothetical protein
MPIRPPARGVRDGTGVPAREDHPPAGKHRRRTAADDGERPTDPATVERYLGKAFDEHLSTVSAAMEARADRYEPVELNRISFRLYEAFRPDVPPGNEGWGAKAVPEIGTIVSGR